MLFNTIFKTAILAVSAVSVHAAPQISSKKPVASESVGTAGQTAVRAAAAVVPTVAAVINGTSTVVVTNTTVK
jgi:hypothetical protein